MTTQTSNSFSVAIVSGGGGSIPAHIQNAAAGQWTAIGTNTIRLALGNFYTTNPPPATDYSTNIAGITTAWCGGCYDPTTHRLYIQGGGHGDYMGNEWYGFNLQSNTWVPHDRPSLYNGTSGGTIALTFPDGAPAAVHTYGSLGVNPITGKCYSFCNRGNNSGCFEWNPALAVASVQVPKVAWLERTKIPSYFGGVVGSSCVWVQTDNVFYVLGKDAGGFFRIAKFTPSTNLWTSISQTGTSIVTSLSYAMSAYCPRLRTIASYHTGITFSTYNIDTNVQSTHALSGLPSSQCNVEYDPIRDRYIIYSEGQSDRRVLYSIHPDTFAVTTISPTGTTPTAPGAGNGVFGRFRYCADYDVFITVSSVDNNVFVYKPVDWTAP